MRIALFEAWSGVAGDMWVGALLDAGVPLAPLADAVRSLGLPGVAVRAERVLRGGLAGTRFCVQVAEPAERGHRGLAEILALLRGAELPEPVRADCAAVFTALGTVEAEMHGIAVEDVHFHEVGADDTIVDVVAACLGTHLLGVAKVCARGIELGSGTVRTAHGLLPVPAPATAALLRGVPVRAGGLPGERTTPTGAALLRTFVHEFEPQLAYVAEAVGYGAGSRDDAEVPNLLRLTVGDARDAGAAAGLVELQCQLDTASGELVGWLLDAALQRGAVDAFAAPVQMKKGRPGLLLTVLCDGVRAAALTEFLLEESTTLGVRRHHVQREVLERWQETRATSFGPVRWKVARLPSGRLAARPEDDELRRLCAEHGLGRAEVLRRLGAG